MTKRDQGQKAKLLRSQKHKRQALKTYLATLATRKDMTGQAWSPVGEWHAVHGDKKSTTAGIFHVETIADSTGVYKAVICMNGDALWNTCLTYDEIPTFEELAQAFGEKADEVGI